MSATEIMRKVRLQHVHIAALLLCAAPAGAALAQAAAKPAAAPAAAAAAAAPAAKPGGGFLPPASSSANVIDSIAVVVNDEVITKNEIANRVRVVTASMKAQNAPMPDAADLQRQVVERMIVELSLIHI